MKAETNYILIKTFGKWHSVFEAPVIKEFKTFEGAQARMKKEFEKELAIETENVEDNELCGSLAIIRYRKDKAIRQKLWTIEAIQNIPCDGGIDAEFSVEEITTSIGSFKALRPHNLDALDEFDFDALEEFGFVKCFTDNSSEMLSLDRYHPALRFINTFLISRRDAKKFGEVAHCFKSKDTRETIVFYSNVRDCFDAELADELGESAGVYFNQCGEELLLGRGIVKNNGSYISATDPSLLEYFGFKE